MASRIEFCTLTGLSAEGLKSRSRRGQLPFGIDGQESHGRYSPFEALLTILSESLLESFAMAAIKAAEIVADLPPALWDRRQDLMHSADALGRSEQPFDLQCGRLLMPGGTQRPVPFCGDFHELLKGNGERPHAVILISGTRALRVLLNRAGRENIDVSQIFTGTSPDYRPRLNRAQDDSTSKNEESV